MHVDAPECTLPNYGAKKRVNTGPSLGSDVTYLSHNSSKQSWELTLFFHDVWTASYHLQVYHNNFAFGVGWNLFTPVTGYSALFSSV